MCSVHDNNVVEIGSMLEGMDVMFFTFLMTSIKAKFFCHYFN